MKNVNKQWIKWARDQVSMIKDGGFLIFPSPGAMFRVDKLSKTLNLVFCVPSWLGSEIEKINRSVFSSINFTYVAPSEIPTNPEDCLRHFFKNYEFYLRSDFNGTGGHAYLKAIIEVFKIDDETLDRLISKLRKKRPINPVTIYGEDEFRQGPGNLTVGRIWIRNSISIDAPIRFNPQRLSPNYEKPVTLVLWRHEAEINSENSTSYCTVNENDFIQAINILQAQDKKCLKIWGKADNAFPASDRVDVGIIFEKDSERDELCVSVEKEKVLGTRVILNFSNFIDGMGHLFPNGEIA